MLSHNRDRSLSGLRAKAALFTAFLLSACGQGGGDGGGAESISARDEGIEELPLESEEAGAKATAESEAEGAQQDLGLPSADAVLGPALVIHGEVVPHEVIRKQIVLGSAGQSALEMAKLKVWSDEEIARRVAAGEALQDLEIGAEEVEQAIAEGEAQLKEQYPDGDVSLADFVPEQEVLVSRMRVIEQFNKLFLPKDPAKFPPVTVDAFNETETMRLVLKQLQEEGKEREPNPLMDSALFQEVHGYLTRTSDIQEGEDLPVELALRINGKDVRVDDLWNEIEPGISPMDVRMAKQWIVNTRLLREDLEESGLWLSPEEAAAKYAEHSDPYKDSMFSQERMALVIKRYPSIRAYKELRRIYDSFQQKIQSELTPENLKAFADKRTRALIGQAQVDVDVILLSAYDFKREAWLANGWQEAERRAQEVAEAIAEQGNWDELLEEYSGFYDHPIPANMQGQANPTQKNKGRFRAVSRNPLMGMLEESEYWQFLNGRTITDFICFEQEVGTIANPIQGPHGYYIPRLIRRSPAPTSVTLSDENLIEMAEQDYTLVRLCEHVQQLIRENEVYGL